MTVDPPAWRRSTRCGTNACVEVSTGPEVVLVRDSKVHRGPILSFEAARWVDFLDAIKAGDYDWSH